MLRPDFPSERSLCGPSPFMQMALGFRVQIPTLLEPKDLALLPVLRTVLFPVLSPLVQITTENSRRSKYLIFKYLFFFSPLSQRDTKGLKFLECLVLEFCMYTVCEGLCTRAFVLMYMHLHACICAWRFMEGKSRMRIKCYLIS